MLDPQFDKIPFFVYRGINFSTFLYYRRHFGRHTIDFFTFLYYRRHFGTYTIDFFTTGGLSVRIQSISLHASLYYRRHVRYAYNRFLYYRRHFGMHTIDFFTFLYYRRHFGTHTIDFLTTGGISVRIQWALMGLVVV